MTGSALNPTDDKVLEWFTKPMTSRPIVVPVMTMTIPIAEWDSVINVRADGTVEYIDGTPVEMVPCSQ